MTILLNINKLPQPRLFLLVRQGTPRGANEAHIRNISLLASLDQFLRDIHFRRVCRGNDANGVGAGLLECVGHLSGPAGLVLYDLSAVIFEFFAFGGGGV
jgi:hypothetical protein